MKWTILCTWRPRRKENDQRGNDKYLQKFLHRGTIYMDEDTLARAGTDVVLRNIHVLPRVRIRMARVHCQR